MNTTYAASRAVMLAIGLTACMASEKSSPTAVAVSSESEVTADDGMQSYGGAMTDAPQPKKKASVARTRGAGLRAASPAPEPSAEMAMDEAEDDAAPSAPTRSWFPETFLFAPAVATDASGAAQLTVTVPDRLTTWRILAMAHDRQGGRGATVSTFDSVLPTYVDPVVPDALVAGDRLELPIMIVNTTDEKVEQRLTVRARGAGLLDVSGPVALAPQQSVVRYVPIDVRQPGTLVVGMTLGDADRVERRVKVRPPGRPVRVERTGALADQVELRVPLAADARPESVQVGLTVFPGALALVRSELANVLRRSNIADAAYALRVAGTAAPLIRRLGGQADPVGLRKVRLRAGQTLLRAARRPSPSVALLLAQGAGAHPKDPLLGRLSDRMAQQIASLQRPDGTFNFGDGWTLQRVVVATAEGLRALAAVADDEASRRLLKGARIRAEGAFERYIDAVKDPFTAAAVLAAGGVRGTLADTLRTRVREGLTEGDHVRLSTKGSVVGIDGYRPSAAHATALAVLALIDDPAAKDKLAGLGNTLLASYRPAVGWGSGRANLAALAAVTALFADPLPDRVNVQLFNGEEVVAETLLAGPGRTERHEAQAWAPKAVGTPTWRVVATPPVPGLAFSLTVDYRVPWKAAPPAGLTLVAQWTGQPKVGEPLPVTLIADGPRGAQLKVRYALPAGVQPVQSDLTRLVSEGTIQRFSVDAGGVELSLPARAPGSAAKVPFRVVPTFAGRLQAEASTVGLASRSGPGVYVAPKTWVIAKP